MAREHETSVQPWGTLEELLLACAVNRHGTESWDSIAMELANRTTSAALTPDSCRHKFDDLKRRFMLPNDDESASFLPMVDELKKIRVEELRREVRRRDVSIVSLELKVKRLEEEREHSLRGSRSESAGPDSRKNLGGGGAAGGLTAGKSNSGDSSNRSFNESNSTSQKRGDSHQNDGVVVVNGEAGPEPERNELSDPPRTDSEPGKVVDGDDDNNNNNDDDNKNNSNNNNEKDNTKQSSDVQSSMSLSRKKRRRKGGGAADAAVAGSSSGEEPEAEGDEVSPAATKRVSAIKSEPLVKLLGTIRSHRLGSVFQRRLRSQESQRYKNLIRQHLDLQTIQARLEKGVYSNSFHKFFRDLLLLFNNAIVFFRKSSPEHAAAVELRALVLEEMHAKLGKTRPFTAKPEPKKEIDLASKPSKSSIVVKCGNRSSSKAVSEGVNKKGDTKKESRVVEEKQKASEKKINGSFVAIEDKGIRKKRSQERVGRRGLKTGGKGGESEHEFGGNELSSHDAVEVKADKIENAKKKQGVANFLQRMKQNSPKEVEDGIDTHVSEDDSEDSKVGKEEKKKRGAKVRSDERKERITRNSTRGRGTREDSRKAKRGVGRPPKRPEKVAVASGKRGRDNSEPEVGIGGRLKKRSRR
ncbi:Octamer-binding transcription factor [Parasponia andersonii]|uniref:Octamer-binding transcription factor n=1 Tax=Parasponia andersonii TaxID=3476 RepID=A0A2P5BJ55_PARAD|nr:Octamer-binding transcription factor [Parasponia andersonii]